MLDTMLDTMLIWSIMSLIFRILCLYYIGSYLFTVLLIGSDKDMNIYHKLNFTTYGRLFGLFIMIFYLLQWVIPARF